MIERPLVPSAREGGQARVVERQAAGAPEARSALDPRDVGGPLAPLLIVGATAMFVNWDLAALTVLLPDMRADFGFGLDFLAALGGALGIASQLAAPVMGYLADRVRRVTLLRAGGLVSGVMLFAQAVTRSVPGLVLARTAAAGGEAIRAPASYPFLTDVYPVRTRGRVFAILGLIAGLGGVLGALLSGVAAERFGWRAVVGALGLCGVASAAAAFRLREPVRGAQEGPLDPDADPVSWSEAWRAVGAITTLRRLWYAMPFQEVFLSSSSLYIVTYYGEEFGLGPSARGALFAAQGTVGLVALFAAGPIADRLLADRPTRVLHAMAVVYVAYAGSFVVLRYSRSLWLSFAAQLPLGIGLVLLGPAFFTLISLVVPPRIRGMGLQTTAPWRVAGMLLGVALAQVAVRVGVRQTLLLFVPAGLVAAAIVNGAAYGVARDMRSAAAAAAADAEARRAKRKLLVCRDLDVRYDGVQVLFGVDLDVSEGEIVALLGTNGAGKSTLLRAISGIQNADGGAIVYGGRDITHVPAHELAAKGIAMVPGGRGVFGDLTVRENLALAGAHAPDALRERMDDRAGNLSGGEQQMVALAQAFAMRPRLLLIDELSLGLAPAVVRTLLGSLRELAAQGTTIVLVEQSLNVALQIAERAVFMERGEIRFDGTVAELMRTPGLARSVFLGGPVPAARRPRDVSDAPVALEVHDASVRFGGLEALRGVDLRAAAGEVVGVIGPNGAGKTTLFDAISGYLPLDRGTVTLAGTDVTTLPPHERARRGLHRSFQNAQLFGAMTVRETVMVALRPGTGLSRGAMWAPAARLVERRIAKRAGALVDLLGLGAWADRYVDELSTGTRRALDIACVMAREPSVLLLDEPSSGLAQAETEALGPLLRRLVRETGCAMLIVEHDMPLVSSVADRLVAMELGAVVTSGSPHEVLEDPRVLSSYLADGEA